jgi:hypothetical protein
METAHVAKAPGLQTLHIRPALLSNLTSHIRQAVE